MTRRVPHGPAGTAHRAVGRRTTLRAAAGALSLAGLAGCLGRSRPAPRGPLAALGPVDVLKEAGCTCCEANADYLRGYGVTVDVTALDDLAATMERYRIPEAAASCHVAVGDDYVVVGHVPAAAIEVLLTDRPDAVGIALPGMPSGSPGMGGQKAGAFTVLRIDRAGGLAPFAEV